MGHAQYLLKSGSAMLTLATPIFTHFNTEIAIGKYYFATKIIIFREMYTLGDPSSRRDFTTNLATPENISEICHSKWTCPNITQKVTNAR